MFTFSLDFIAAIWQNKCKVTRIVDLFSLKFTHVRFFVVSFHVNYRQTMCNFGKYLVSYTCLYVCAGLKTKPKTKTIHTKSWPYQRKENIQVNIGFVYVTIIVSRLHVFSFKLFTFLNMSFNIIYWFHLFILLGFSALKQTKTAANQANMWMHTL